MNCIYYNERLGAEVASCHAQPIRPREIVHFYIPTQYEVEKYCKNSFNSCLRFKAFQDHKKIFVDSLGE